VTVTSKFSSDPRTSLEISPVDAPYSTPFDREPPLAPQDYASAVLRLEVATYISQMSTELSTMARNSDMPLLSYFLDMAAAEARSTDGKLREALQIGSDPDTASTPVNA
jgi:hypothetical protein